MKRRVGPHTIPKYYYSMSSKNDLRAMIVDTDREYEADGRRVRITNLSNNG